MTCDDFQQQLLEYLDGELATEVRDSMEQHAAGCEQCAHMLVEQRSVAAVLSETMRRTTDDLRLSRNVRQAVLAQGLQPSLLEFFAAWWRQASRKWAFATLLAVLACFFAAERIGIFADRRAVSPEPELPPVVVSVRVPQALACYVFQKQADGTVIDSLVFRTNVLQERVWVEHRAKSPSEIQ